MIRFLGLEVNKYFNRKIEVLEYQTLLESINIAFAPNNVYGIQFVLF